MHLVSVINGINPKFEGELKDTPLQTGFHPILAAMINDNQTAHNLVKIDANIENTTEDCKEIDVEVEVTPEVEKEASNQSAETEEQLPLKETEPLITESDPVNHQWIYLAFPAELPKYTINNNNHFSHEGVNKLWPKGENLLAPGALYRENLTSELQLSKSTTDTKEFGNSEYPFWVGINSMEVTGNKKLGDILSFIKLFGETKKQDEGISKVNSGVKPTISQSDMPELLSTKAKASNDIEGQLIFKFGADMPKRLSIAKLISDENSRASNEVGQLESNQGDLTQVQFSNTSHLNNDQKVDLNSEVQANETPSAIVAIENKVVTGLLKPGDIDLRKSQESKVIVQEGITSPHALGFTTFSANTNGDVMDRITATAMTSSSVDAMPPEELHLKNLESLPRFTALNVTKGLSAMVDSAQEDSFTESAPYLVDTARHTLALKGIDQDSIKVIHTTVDEKASGVQDQNGGVEMEKSTRLGDLPERAKEIPSKSGERQGSFQRLVPVGRTIATNATSEMIFNPTENYTITSSNLEEYAEQSKTIAKMNLPLEPQSMSELILSASQGRENKVSNWHVLLQPEELGSLEMEVRVEEGKVYAKLTAYTTIGLECIEASLPELHQLLINQGVNLGSLMVGLFEENKFSYQDNQRFQRRNNSHSSERQVSNLTKSRKSHVTRGYLFVDDDRSVDVFV